MHIRPRHIASAALLMALLPHAALAQQSIITAVPGCSFDTGQINAGCVPAFLAHIIRFVFGLSGAFAVIMIVIAGYQIALAKVFNRDRSEGFTRLRVAVVGFILCACSWFIVDFIVQSLAFG
ncbi:hypothetical protein COU78_03380 [Candidatus Peregrinibacteria bacterium CG10_big_fil_rev_8_21_14_0_10_49_24]|nr:MAG: hypothetical protein COV83_05200 [Candidatus Peregrinibacteria bacterium CG11_big_fil_rev_8_21_14_0_20_49_14]PIR51162.1 MAG: hypothetical protein COU78_03380 [Candidatus Peregrinibacteria bacterium CG10_big_fil_rev_8_21_14_0_10_49_24]PJA67201.1 MAG: hypothetical protein CO157_05535 [Candidatus Peregrinibacteria bacterium CG_4_9_14_3_um_filter_49_12]